MIRSQDRILTTHVGSLPRNDTLTDLLVSQEAGEKIRPQEAGGGEGQGGRRHRQAASRMPAGIDIGNDGEQQRVGFQTYVPQRMSGFGGESEAAGAAATSSRVSRTGRNPEAPLSAREQAAERAGSAGRAEISRHQAAIKEEVARFKKIAAGQFTETFMTAPSPGIIATTMLNAYYDSYDELSRPRSRARWRTNIKAIHDGRHVAADRRARSRHGLA